jgi:hypothetical protein
MESGETSCVLCLTRYTSGHMAQTLTRPHEMKEAVQRLSSATYVTASPASLAAATNPMDSSNVRTPSAHGPEFVIGTLRAPIVHRPTMAWGLAADRLYKLHPTTAVCDVCSRETDIAGSRERETDQIVST